MKINIKEISYYFFVRLPNTIIGRYITRNLVKVHWGRGLNNFGDCLQPHILKHYGLKPVYVTSLAKSEIVLQGSILQLLPDDYQGYIIGTGGDIKEYKLLNSKILAVRGGKIAECIGCKEAAFGDTGLLAPLAFRKRTDKRFKLGIVLHFVDAGTGFERKLRQKLNGKDIVFINILDNAKKVINQIQGCNSILSSSLHGLIIADAYHIPNRRIVNRETMPTSFYDFKFEDYYSSLGIEETPLQLHDCGDVDATISRMTLKPSERIDELIGSLDLIMKEVASKFKK